MKKVLVTGASGFIGRHTIPFLLKRGFEVHTVSLQNELTFPDSVQQHSLNLLESTSIDSLMREVRPTHLLHFAWCTTPRIYWNSEENLQWVKASIDLLQYFAKQGGKRVVMAGTCAEYNWESGICDESSTLLSTSTLYGVCKSSLYQIASAFTKQLGLSFSWGRIFYLYGPFEHSERLVPSIVLSLLRKEVAKCSHGKQIRDFLYVEDVADAFSSLLDSAISGAINIASGRPISLKEVIEHIAVSLDAKERVQFGALSAVGDAPKIQAVTERLKNELNWIPKFSLEEGLRRTINWWKTQKI